MLLIYSFRLLGSINFNLFKWALMSELTPLHLALLLY